MHFLHKAGENSDSSHQRTLRIHHDKLPSYILGLVASFFSPEIFHRFCRHDCGFSIMRGIDANRVLDRRLPVAQMEKVPLRHANGRRSLMAGKRFRRAWRKKGRAVANDSQRADMAKARPLPESALRLRRVGRRISSLASPPLLRGLKTESHEATHGLRLSWQLLIELVLPYSVPQFSRNTYQLEKFHLLLPYQPLEHTRGS